MLRGHLAYLLISTMASLYICPRRSPCATQSCLFRRNALTSSGALTLTLLTITLTLLTTLTSQRWPAFHRELVSRGKYSSRIGEQRLG